MQLLAAIAIAEGKPAAYVLMSAQGKYLYKGSCRNLKERLKDHRAGRVTRTKNRRPLHLAFYQYCPTFTEARRMENHLKTGAGRKWQCL